jgi:hypothetical protein
MWHEDGLPALPSPPQFYQELRISAEQVTIDDPVRWVYGKGPEIVPGACPSPEACGPASDLVLRYSIHVLEGDLLTYLREVVSSSDVFLAHERLAGRSAREPGYFTLESPYDRWVYLEGQTHLAATAPALVRFSRGYHLAFGTPLIDPLTGAWSSKLDNGTHAYLGGYEGTFNLLLQRRADEVSIAVIFNIAGNYSSLVDELDAVTISDSEWGL